VLSEKNLETKEKKNGFELGKYMCGGDKFCPHQESYQDP
jgi:hypothetical protein